MAGINIISQTETEINFNVTKLETENINKVEILVNDALSQTYTTTFDNLIYTINKLLCWVGDNKIKIKVTYNDALIIEQILTYTYSVTALSNTATLHETIDRIQVLSNTTKNNKNILKGILASKSIAIDSGATLLETVNKVSELMGKSPIPIYTVVINLTDNNPLTRCSYDDDAVGITPATASGLGGWANIYPFNKIMPCTFDTNVYTPNKTPKSYIKGANYKQWLDNTTAITSTDDVMVEFPKFYWRVKNTGSEIRISVCEAKITPEFVNYSHRRSDGSLASKIYIGAYLGYISSLKLYSQYGKTPTSATMSNLRTYSTSRGAQNVTYSMIIMLQVLYTLAYKNTKGSSFSMGLINVGSAKTTGGGDTSGFTYGEQSGTLQMKLFGIEDLWGNYECFADGVCADANGIYLGFSSFNDLGTGYLRVGDWINYPQGVNYPDSSSQGTIQEVRGTSELPFFPSYLRNFKYDSAYYDWNHISMGTYAIMGMPYNAYSSGQASSSKTIYALDVWNSASLGHPSLPGRLAFVPGY